MKGSFPFLPAVRDRDFELGAGGERWIFGRLQDLIRSSPEHSGHSSRVGVSD